MTTPTVIPFRELLEVQGGEQVVGSTGLGLNNGTISEETNTDLRNYSRRFQFYQEMTRDAAIATLLDAIKLPLLASEFTVVAASDQTEDIFLRDFVTACMNGMARQSWGAHVRDCLEALEFGFSLSEIVLEKRSDGLLYLRNLEPRGQETLDRWEHDPQLGFTAFVQRDPVTGSTFTIPLDKMVHVTYRGRKRNPEGESFLRPLYRTYKLKREYEVMQAIATERDMGGMPVAYIEPQSVIEDEALEALDEALANMRRDVNNFLRPPAGVTVAPYASGSGAQLAMAKILDSLKMDIFFRGFAQFLTLGTTGVGTQALVQGDIDFFHLGLISIQQELLDAWNTQLIPYLLVANGYELTQLTPPKVQWADPGHKSIRDALEAYKIGVEVGLYEANDADEDYMRSIHDLPPRTSVTTEPASTERDRNIKPFVAAAYTAQGLITPMAPQGPGGNSNSGSSSSSSGSSSSGSSGGSNGV